MRLAQHVDSETIYALLDGRLEPSRARCVEAHVWRCDRCRALRESCGAVLSSLRWYASAPPAPPAGYWEDFWTRWSPTTRAVRWSPRRASSLAASLIAATLVLLAAGGLWFERGPRPAPERVAVDTGPARNAVAGTEWARDVETLERVTFAVGGVDPMAKGVVLASLAEEP